MTLTYAIMGSSIIVGDGESVLFLATAGLDVFQYEKGEHPWAASVGLAWTQVDECHGLAKLRELGVEVPL